MKSGSNMCSDRNPCEGMVATNLTELVEISEKANKYRHTSDRLVWVDVETGREVATSCL